MPIIKETIKKAPHPIVDTMPTQPYSGEHAVGNASSIAKNKVLIIVGLVLVVILLAETGYLLWKKYHPTTVVHTPAQTLEDLRQVSGGKDKETIQQKSATMNALEKNSKKTTVTKQEQLNILNALK
jgi:hypothetical protein